MVGLASWYTKKQWVRWQLRKQGTSFSTKMLDDIWASYQRVISIPGSERHI